MALLSTDTRIIFYERAEDLITITGFSRCSLYIAGFNSVWSELDKTDAVTFLYVLARVAVNGDTRLVTYLS